MKINSLWTTIAILLAILTVSIFNFLPDEIWPGVIIGVGLSFLAVGAVEVRNWIDEHPHHGFRK